MKVFTIFTKWLHAIWKQPSTKVSFRTRVHTKTADKKIQIGKRPRISENVEMHTAGCREEDVARQFNVHPSTFSRLLNSFQVTRQVNTRQRHRRQLKTTIRKDHFNVTTLRRKFHICKQSCLWVTLDVWSEDKWPECKEQVATGCQSTRSKTCYCDTFDSTSSSNAFYHDNHTQRQCDEVFFTDEYCFMGILQMHALVFG
jgi:AraC-like DNA-binding protein